jgi:hypothetical protein
MACRPSGLSLCSQWPAAGSTCIWGGGQGRGRGAGGEPQCQGWVNEDILDQRADKQRPTSSADLATCTQMHFMILSGWNTSLRRI